MGEGMPRLLTVKKAASEIHVCAETVRRAIRAGKLAAYRRPGGYRVSTTDLQAYMDTYHCPASEMINPTWNYVAANGRSSGGKREKENDFRLAQRTRNALAKR
ncbi:hypothetical protein JCM15831A_12300 [Asaia astilbis]